MIDSPNGSRVTRLRVSESLFLVLQLGLLLSLALVYRLELDRGFGVLAPLVLLGFMVHMWLPMRIRLPFFLVLTIVALALLLGWNSVWLILLGAGLIAICHLGIQWHARVALLIAAGAGLALLRSGSLEVPWAGSVLSILGAMFMFRIILYIYDLKEDHTDSTIWQRIAYFFLLPNVCFPLFPVIDYKTFISKYYDESENDIYQRGIFWVANGIAHLLLYRVLYYLIPRIDMTFDGSMAVYLYMASVYGLYLRVSGLFHLITGILMLFGFNLPRTNNRYFLASSFNDLWRRINIYWKDFMMSVVFYPVFMSTRRWAMEQRLMIAVVCVFVVTWFLHSYQWFWLQGRFPIRGTDIAFWGTLGIVLAINTVMESRRGRQRIEESDDWSMRRSVIRSLKIFGVFSFMALLWSLWESESLSEWGHRIAGVWSGPPRSHVQLTGVALALIGVGVLVQWLASMKLFERVKAGTLRRSQTLISSMAVIGIVLGLPFVQAKVGGPLAKVVQKAQATELNAIDLAREERSYYEALSRGGNVRAIGGSAELPADWAPIYESDAVRLTDDIRGWELIPSARTQFKGQWLTTNRWGMRDRDYRMEKPDGVFRIALVGFSPEMGAGVGDLETFENVLEDRLNAGADRFNATKFEVLNFSVGAYGRLQAVHVAENVIPPFEPDIILYAVHPGEEGRMIDRLAMVVNLGVTLDGDYPFIADILDRSRAVADLPAGEFGRRIQPSRRVLLEWAYDRLVQAAMRSGAIPIFLFMQIPNREFPKEELENLTRLALQSGGTVLSLANVYEGYRLEEIRVAEWDDHPNPFGHKLIADSLYSRIVLMREELELPSSALNPGVTNSARVGGGLNDER